MSTVLQTHQLTAGYGDFANRGAAAWLDTTTGKRRIFVATIDARLFAVDAVTRNARLIGHNGPACTGQAVKERGLAHVRPPDDDQGWKLTCHEFADQSNLPL